MKSFKEYAGYENDLINESSEEIYVRDLDEAIKALTKMRKKVGNVQITLRKGDRVNLEQGINLVISSVYAYGADQTFVGVDTQGYY